MPFQSEKQRRYLWANEPEIARDWTDTYGSGIAKALGGRIGFWNGSGNIRQQPHQPRDLLVQNNPYGTRPRYQPPGGGATSMGSGRDVGGGGGGGGPPGGGDRQMTYTAPTPQPTHTDRIIDIAQRKKRQDIRDDIARREAEKDYTPKGIMKTGPQLGFSPTRGPNIGNWASGFAGSKIGGGLGSMLFGPWGALLGALFGRGVGKRAYTASQTPEKETLRDIMLGQNTLLSNILSKKKTPTTTGEGLGGIDLSKMVDKFNPQDPGAVGIENKFADDLSGIEGQQAKLKGLALAQYRVLQKKQAYEPYGGEKMTPKDKQFLNRLEEMMKEEKMYSLPLIG